MTVVASFLLSMSHLVLLSPLYGKMVSGANDWGGVEEIVVAFFALSLSMWRAVGDNQFIFLETHQLHFNTQ